MKRLLMFLFLGLTVRVLLIPQPGFEADMAFWKSWSLAANDKGVVWLVTNTNYNYPAGFALILWLVGKLYSLFADPQNYHQYWLAGNYFYLFLIKLLPIISDLGIAALLYAILSRPSLLGLSEKLKKISLWAPVIWLFHPVVLYDGVWWGQVDSFGVLFVFLSLYFLLSKRPLLATAALVVGFMFKMQNIIFLPLFFAFLFLNYSWKEMVKALGIAFITYLVLSFPFLLAGNLGRTFTLIANNADWFPYLSLRAYNLWWLYAGGQGMSSDKILVFGLTSAKTFGLILFAFSYLLACFVILKKKGVLPLITSFFFVAFSFFILPTQSHERYLFSALALFFLLIPVFWQNLLSRKIIVFLLIVSAFTSLVNLNNAMIANYPQNGIGLLNVFSEERLVYSQIISVFNLVLFFASTLWLVKQLPWFLSSGAVLFAFGLLISINIPFFSVKEVSLTKIKPLLTEQGYGLLQTNRNLNSMLGPKSWSFLSVNYYFYKKGFATHANSKISFDLAKKFSRFATDFGLDTSAGDQATVVFQIYTDGNLAFTSNIVRKFDLPTRVEIPVKEVKTLTLVVNDAQDSNSGDHADWLNPVLYK